jgi:hypothetical protein
VKFRKVGVGAGKEGARIKADYHTDHRQEPWITQSHRTTSGKATLSTQQDREEFTHWF